MLNFECLALQHHFFAVFRQWCFIQCAKIISPEHKRHHGNSNGRHPQVSADFLQAENSTNWLVNPDNTWSSIVESALSEQAIRCHILHTLTYFWSEIERRKFTLICSQKFLKKFHDNYDLCLTQETPYEGGYDLLCIFTKMSYETALVFQFTVCCFTFWW